MKTWPLLVPPEEEMREYRAYILNEMADAMEENLDHLASVEAMDIGKPLMEAKDQMKLSASTYRYFASAIMAQDDTMVLHDQGSISCLIREPLGVVGLILPWNAPCMLLSWKAAPALAAIHTCLDHEKVVFQRQILRQQSLRQYIPRKQISN